tara:strand:- start:1063 stop:1221 length:159 start_codon:yes stop_codon:yes gene_type:complete
VTKVTRETREILEKPVLQVQLETRVTRVIPEPKVTKETRVKLEQQVLKEFKA